MAHHDYQTATQRSQSPILCRVCRRDIAYTCHHSEAEWLDARKRVLMDDVLKALRAYYREHTAGTAR